MYTWFLKHKITTVKFNSDWKHNSWSIF